MMLTKREGKENLPLGVFLQVCNAATPSTKLTTLLFYVFVYSAT